MKKITFVIFLSIFLSSSLFASFTRKGFHFLLDVAPKFNYIEMTEKSEGGTKGETLKFAQCQVDLDLTGEYMFNEWAGLNIRLSAGFDAATTSYLLYEFKDRYSLSTKIGPRFYLCDFIYFDADFVIGRAAYYSTGAYYMTLGCDASFGFEVVQIPFFTFAIRPVFSYRRGSYSNEFAGGVYLSVSL